MIAIVMQARHLCSSDTSFDAIGKRSGIPYQSDFHAYKKYLYCMKDIPMVQNTMQWFNFEVFPRSNGPQPSNPHAEGDDEREDGGLKAFHKLLLDVGLWGFLTAPLRGRD